MTADAQGNDLQSVKYVVTSKIKLAPYDPSKALVAAMIAAGVKDPFTTLADIFADGSFVGLITSDGAPQDSRDSDDAIEFHQPGYSLNADPSLTLAFTVAEDNALTRELTIGKPDANGVYHVKDTIQDSKWFAYQETVYKSGIIRRRLGVIQITGNEPAQDTRGGVSGLALTAQWQTDSTVDSGNSRYLQSYYDPATAPTPVESVTLTPATATVTEGEDVDLTVAFTPADAADQTYKVESSDAETATVVIKQDAPLTVTVHGVKGNATPATITITSTDGAKKATSQVTVNAPAPTLGELTVTAAALAGGKSVLTVPEPDSGNMLRYKVTAANALPEVAYDTVCATDDGWADIPADKAVPGAAGQIVTVVELTTQGAKARKKGQSAPLA